LNGALVTKRFLLRLNDQLYEELRRWAADDLRSVNGQIEFLLKDAVRRRRRRDVDDTETNSVDR
jgi:hypothetical protein